MGFCVFRGSGKSWVGCTRTRNDTNVLRFSRNRIMWKALARTAAELSFEAVNQGMDRYRALLNTLLLA